MEEGRRGGGQKVLSRCSSHGTDTRPCGNYQSDVDYRPPRNSPRKRVARALELRRAAERGRQRENSQGEGEEEENSPARTVRNSFVEIPSRGGIERRSNRSKSRRTTLDYANDESKTLSLRFRALFAGGGGLNTEGRTETVDHVARARARDRIFAFTFAAGKFRHRRAPPTRRGVFHAIS